MAPNSLTASGVPTSAAEGNGGGGLAAEPVPVRPFTPRMHSRPSVRMFDPHEGVEMSTSAYQKKKEAAAAAAAAAAHAVKQNGTKQEEAGLAGGAGGGKIHPPCYLEEASWWSVLTFGWMNPVIKIGNKRTLTEADMPGLAKRDQAVHVQDLVESHWEAEMKLHPEAPQLWRAMVKAFFPVQLPMYFPFVIVTTAKIVQAHVGVKGLIHVLDSGGAASEGYIYAGVIVFTGWIMLMLHHQVQFMGWRLGLAMRTSLEAAIFRKILRMPLSCFSSQSGGAAEEEKAGGKAAVGATAAAAAAAAKKKKEENEYKSTITAATILNLATTDVERFQPVATTSHYLFLCPLEILAITWCGVAETGLPFLIGMLALLLLIPIQGQVAKVLQGYSKRASQLTDQRVRLTKQAIQGARTIKMSGWELLLEKRIKEARKAEMKVLLLAGLVRGIHEGIYFFSPVLVGAATFLTDWGLGRELDASRVFSTLTLFNILQWDVVNFGGKAMQSVGEAWVSLGRLEHLLRMPELPSHRLEAATGYSSASCSASSSTVSLPSSSPFLPPRPPPVTVHVNNLSFNWDGPESNQRPTLREVSFVAAQGKILGLAGPVGSGKSTLLLAMLGELGVYDRSVVDIGNGPLAYASQEPWILTGSVRDNILMGRPYIHDKYIAVLKAACLKTDLTQWEHGDHTVIGDRGVNMSGGQRARIGLARMAYGDASLYLIDDALSALDPKVGRRVFSRLICGLLKGSTRILATHQLQYLLEAEEVPKVLFINRGKVRGEGTMQDLLTRGFFPDAQLEMVPTPKGEDLVPTVVRTDTKEGEEAEGEHTGASGTLLSKGKKARPSNLPPFLPSRALSSIDSEGEDRMDSEGNSPAAHLAEAPELFTPKASTLKARIRSGLLKIKTPHRSGTTPGRAQYPPAPPGPDGEPLVIQPRATPFHRQQQLSQGHIVFPLTPSSSMARTKRTPSSISLSMPNLDFSQDGGVQDLLSDEDEALTDEMEEDEFNHPHPATVTRAPTPGGMNQEQVNEHVAYMQQELSIKEGASSEDDDDDDDDDESAMPRSASAAALAVLQAKEKEEQEDEDGEGATKGNVQNLEEEKTRKDAAQKASIIAQEEQKTGQLGAGTYTAYMKGMGGIAVSVGVLLLIAAGQVAAIVSNLFLSHWVRLPYDNQQNRRYAIIYIVLVGVVGIVSVTRAMVAFDRMLRASQHLHDDMIHAVLRAPISFFDTNPTGRIINRTTKDVLMCDALLPVTMYSFLQTMLMCLGTIGVVISVNPWLLIVLGPLAMSFIPLRRQFLNTSREARRLESVARSPVYALFSEAMDGLPTIRSLVVGALFQSEFARRLDDFSRPYFVFFAAGRHLGFRLDFLCWLMMTATAFSSMAASAAASGVSEWLVGMSLMYVLQLAAIFQWATRQSSDVENQIVSVERIQEYCQIAPEAALISEPGRAPPANWPDKGAIVVTNLQAAYRPGLPLVLKGLTFSIPGGARVGIVGRTGCGKSSLIQALFRLMEPSGGSLKIDGIDTSTLGLHDLRRRLSVIPQNPFLFSGTLRENLDPTGVHDDAAIWSALRAVQMEDQVQMMGVDFGKVGSILYTPLAASRHTPSSRKLSLGGFAASTPTNAMGMNRSTTITTNVSAILKPLGLLGPGLDLHVTENGGNLSLGERQLLCLARAILSATRILVCDEATANVDVETDQKIQRAIRERFATATVLMIAHRLNTIIDSDILLVLEAGRVLEMGHPHELLNTPKGLPASKGGFLSLVMETGPDTAASLKEMARVAWEAKQKKDQE